MNDPTLADMMNLEWWTVTRMFGAILAAWVTVYMFSSLFRKN